jgi:hypothetical protein
MMMSNQERFVQLALDAFYLANVRDRGWEREQFELELRRLMMQEPSPVTLTTAAGFPGVTVTSTGTANQHILHG